MGYLLAYVDVSAIISYNLINAIYLVLLTPLFFYKSFSIGIQLNILDSTTAVTVKLLSKMSTTVSSAVAMTAAMTVAKVVSTSIAMTPEMVRVKMEVAMALATTLIVAMTLPQ